MGLDKWVWCCWMSLSYNAFKSITFLFFSLILVFNVLLAELSTYPKGSQINNDFSFFGPLIRTASVHMDFPFSPQDHILLHGTEQEAREFIKCNDETPLTSPVALNNNGTCFARWKVFWFSLFLTLFAHM